MKKVIYVLMLALFINACKAENKKSDNIEVKTEQKKEITTKNILKSYFELQKALADDKNDLAKKAGENMLAAFSSFDMSKLSHAQHTEYMDIAESSKEHASHIMESDITHQREHFEMLTKDMADLIALLGAEQKVYQVYCPMYKNNQGGTWLSEIEEVDNPYFGHRMKKCGSVQKTIN